jgi:hypothetical protein
MIRVEKDVGQQCTTAGRYLKRALSVQVADVVSRLTSSEPFKTDPGTSAETAHETV